MNEMLNLSATELLRRLRTKDVSSRELVEAHLQRIEEVNPAINAVVTVDADAALAAAAEADRTTASGAPVGPLHGLPMTHKDTHQTRGMRTTNGSVIFKDQVPDQDDLIISRLRQAGVISTGKNNVPEFAAGSHTFNDVFGTTTNPYAPDQVLVGPAADWPRLLLPVFSPWAMAAIWVAPCVFRRRSATWWGSGPPMESFPHPLRSTPANGWPRPGRWPGRWKMLPYSCLPLPGRFRSSRWRPR